MRTRGVFLLTSLAVTAAAAAVTALLLSAQSLLTARALSDALVYACFLLLTVGTLLGVFNVGYHRRSALPGEPPEELLEQFLKDALQPDRLGWAVLAAGVLCFGAAILVDVVFL